MKTATTRTFVIDREDGSYTVLAAINNSEELFTPATFDQICRDLRDTLAKNAEYEVMVLARSDLVDILDLDSEEVPVDRLPIARTPIGWIDPSSGDFITMQIDCRPCPVGAVPPEGAAHIADVLKTYCMMGHGDMGDLETAFIDFTSDLMHFHRSGDEKSRYGSTVRGMLLGLHPLVADEQRVARVPDTLSGEFRYWESHDATPYNAVRAQRIDDLLVLYRELTRDPKASHAELCYDLAVYIGASNTDINEVCRRAADHFEREVQEETEPTSPAPF